MLKEIKSNAFKSSNGLRPAIHFHEGLNVILGSDNSDNSIGKSTFLMIIDFVFGGNDYIEKGDDILTNVKEHDIYFTFHFEKDYKFCREFKKESYKQVVVCDENYNKTENVWRLDDYLKWLKEKYQTQPSMTFRQEISRYFRIYQKDNLNETKPLKSAIQEPDSTGIDNTIKMFNLFTPIEDVQKAQKTAEEKKKAFTNAQKYNYVPKITKTKYEENIKKIADLEQQKKDLAEKSGQNLLELDSQKADRISALKLELSSLNRQKRKIEAKIKTIESNQDLGNIKITKDFSELTDFFDNVNIKNLETIENFHKSITTILENESKDELENLNSELQIIKSQIEELQTKIKDVGSAAGLSTVVLNHYSDIDKELAYLKKENESYTNVIALDTDLKTKTQSLETIYMLQAKSLEDLINPKMNELNSCVYGTDINTPKLTINTPKTYTFVTPNDNGTGTNFKGMVIFDLACKDLTSLPAIAHDSPVLKQISKTTLEKIFELYNASQKQIFVTFDNIKTYSQKTQDIISAKTVLFLSAGNELFGTSWGKK